MALKLDIFFGVDGNIIFFYFPCLHNLLNIVKHLNFIVLFDFTSYFFFKNDQKIFDWEATKFIKLQLIVFFELIIQSALKAYFVRFIMTCEIKCYLSLTYLLFFTYSISINYLIFLKKILV